MTKIGCRRTEPQKPLKRRVLTPKKQGTVSRSEIRKAIRNSTLRVRRDPLDVLFSRYIRLRDKGTCQKCGKYIGLTQGLHCAHFFGRSNQRCRFDPEYCVSLCFGDHQYFHAHPLEFTNWTRQRLGEKAFDELTARANLNHYKIDRQAIELYLREKIKELEQHG